MIHEDDEFAHDSGEGDFGGFSSITEALVKVFEGGIVADCGESSHVEDATHVGVSNNINVPGRGNLLARSVFDAITAHRGPFYELTYPPEARTEELREHFGLVRVPGGCTPIASTIKVYALEICKLQRSTPADRPG